MAARPTPSDPSGDAQTPPDAVLSLRDPRAVSILTSEYSNLQSARSLVYNEAFTRGAMFL
jgi:hypothetical protein